MYLHSLNPQPSYVYVWSFVFSIHLYVILFHSVGAALLLLILCLLYTFIVALLILTAKYSNSSHTLVASFPSCNAKSEVSLFFFGKSHIKFISGNTITSIPRIYFYQLLRPILFTVLFLRYYLTIIRKQWVDIGSSSISIPIPKNVCFYSLPP